MFFGTAFGGFAAIAAVGCETHGDRVYGTKGQLAPGYQTCRVHLAEAWEDIPAEEWVELTAPEDYPDSRTAYLDAFCRAVMDDTDPPVGGAEGRRSLEIARGA
jgi:predicted dehydrogenase